MTGPPRKADTTRAVQTERIHAGIARVDEIFDDERGRSGGARVAPLHRMLARSGAAAVTILLLAACHERADSSTTATKSAAVVSNDDAVTRFTNARCERELDCNNVGSGKKYADREACVREVGHNARIDLRPEVCAYGVSERRLEACLSDVRNERCGNPVDTLERFATCRRGKLCLDD